MSTPSVLDQVALTTRSIHRINRWLNPWPARDDRFVFTRSEGAYNNTLGLRLIASQDHDSANFGAYGWFSHPELRIPVRAGTTVSMQCHVRPISGRAGQLGWIFYDNAGDRVGGTFFGTPSGTNSALQIVSASTEVPAGATYAGFIFGLRGPTRAGDSVWFSNFTEGTEGPFTGRRLDSQTSFYSWAGEPNNSPSIERRDVDLAPDAYRINAERGGDSDGPIPFRVSVGTLTADLNGDHAEKVRAGDPLVLTHRPTGQALMTATVADVAVDYIKPKGMTSALSARTHISATDAVDDIANTMRYGATLTETWTERLDNYVRNSWPAGVPAPREELGSPSVSMQPIVLESSLASHLDLLCTSGPHVWGGDVGWFIDRTGVPVFARMAANRALGTPSAFFTDGTGRTDNPFLAVLPYSELSYNRTTRDAINDLRVIVQRGIVDRDNPGQMVLQEQSFGPYTHEESIRKNRRRQGTITYIQAPFNEHFHERLATAVLQRTAEPRAAFRSVTIPMHRALPAERIERQTDLMALDLGGVVGILQNAPTIGAHAPVKIRRIRHTIEPRQWIARYDFI